MSQVLVGGKLYDIVLLGDPTTGNAVSPGGSVGTTAISGQTKIATTGTQVVVGSSTGLANGVAIKASKKNAANIMVGPTGVTATDDGTGNGFELAPGDSISFSVSTLANLFINGTSGDFITYTGN